MTDGQKVAYVAVDDGDGQPDLTDGPFQVPDDHGPAEEAYVDQRMGHRDDDSVDVFFVYRIVQDDSDDDGDDRAQERKHTLKVGGQADD